MNTRSISELVLHHPPLLRTDQALERAVAQLIASDLPALPVVDADDRFRGIFGEREFMQALFPGYVQQLRHAAFISRSLDDAIEKRDACRSEPVGRHMNTDHVDVGPDFSDVQIAEIFLHHRVLVVPIVDDGHVEGMLTRHGFFQALARRFLDS